MNQPVYVALGSSMAAGPGIKPVADRAAGRSARNYPHLVAQRHGYDLIDATVSGATSANILDTPQRGLGRTFDPQITLLVPEAALVTITIGGNDLGYIGTLTEMSLLAPLGLVPKRFKPRRLAPSFDRSQADYDRVTDSICDVVERVRATAPGARILLVDYLTMLGSHPPSFRAFPLPSKEKQACRTVAAGLAECFSVSAARTGVELVAASAASVDHGVGSPEPWVTGFDFGNPLTRNLKAPFHPTARGMEAVADLIGEQLGRAVP
jgi:lysophospholipase L1-like esterase